MARKQLQYLSEPMYYLLLSLTEPRHGYSIMKHITELTKGRVNVGPGTLYALLSRFEKEGLIYRIRLSETKKTYEISDAGRKILKDEFKRLELLIEHGKLSL